MRELLSRAVETLEREGVRRTAEKVVSVVHDYNEGLKYKRRNPHDPEFYDVAFINGCDYSLPHPIRYRVSHQIEQLQASGLTVKMLEAGELTLDDVTCARNFIIFRCPASDAVEQFIALAKMLNKQVYFDVDDLVIDTKFTDTVAFLDTLPADERAPYDEGVRLMNRTLRFCGQAITSTEGLAEGLRTIVDEVYVNRNTASDDMLYYSDKAIFIRDELPDMDERDVPDDMKQYRGWAIEQRARREAEGCVIGYFSGSITHNEDFELVLPALLSVLEKRPDVRLKVLGLLDIPEQLAPYRDRILTDGFISWKELPEAIASVDINIAPIKQSIFNEAKSENKWVEAAIVKVPTIASNVGAFKRMIESGVTGVLCENTTQAWEEALLDLVDHPDKRLAIGEAANDFCREHCTTMRAGDGLARYLESRQNENAFFCLPSLDTSGGVLVILKHCCILQDRGFDVTVIDDSHKATDRLIVFEDHVIPVIHANAGRNIDQRSALLGRIDRGIATYFTTVQLFKNSPNVRRIEYCVQGFELVFFQPSHVLRTSASATYHDPTLEYVTISKWCKQWLEEDYGQTVRYAPNGIDCDVFYPTRRDFGSGKIRVLIEGDPKAKYKNVDEAASVANRLDPERFEVWYMSYSSAPKEWYRVDRFLQGVPHDQVADVYRQCHILLKTSLLESFSYPPLEMMATGGHVVAVPNEGNVEYLEHEKNCLLFEHGDIEAGVRCIERIADDAELRDTLYEGGVACAQSRDWKNIEEAVYEMYR